MQLEEATGQSGLTPDPFQAWLVKLKRLGRARRRGRVGIGEGNVIVEKLRATILIDGYKAGKDRSRLGQLDELDLPVKFIE